MSAALGLAALLIDASIGYPGALYRRIGHPVTWIGRLISALDRGLNRDGAPANVRRAAGIVALILLLLAAIGSGWLLTTALPALLHPAIAVVLLACIASTLIAQRSLHDHVAAVARGLDTDGLAGGRRAVAMIVGRDPETLDTAGVCRAAIESLAENFSDGVVAPLFWLVVGGLPGIFGYKAINTADSMIGHKTARHLAFGWAAARTDDLVNLPASRLAALFLILAAVTDRDASARVAVRAVARDAAKHRSPNAGWPEAAMAGALGLRLAGPRSYSGVVVDDHWMGDGRGDANAGDIRRALSLYRRACVIEAVLIAALSAPAIAAIIG
ncbi:MAG: adenosylcobinamide-phosphate synthase CbiB [Hyphomicrobium sp.]